MPRSGRQSLADQLVMILVGTDQKRRRECRQAELLRLGGGAVEPGFIAHLAAAQPTMLGRVIIHPFIFSVIRLNQDLQSPQCSQLLQAVAPALPFHLRVDIGIVEKQERLQPFFSNEHLQRVFGTGAAAGMQ